MSKQISLTEEIDYLKKVTGQDESAIFARAIKKGVEELYKEEMVSLYLKGKFTRKKLIALIGTEAVEEIDYQKKAIEADKKWGMEGA
ncbi:MAG: hypothetical protein C4526_01255 [Nitrospiraceae bacterium]|nr:MAG: hypothetical protein C4526_01255 [Nitrospiraceae bacterium]